jgi:hypothetical protein
MKDGVVYVLRFGQIAANTGDVAAKTDDADKAEDSDTPEKKDEPTGSNRYIFVSAQFDASSIPQPELDPLPGESPAEDKPVKEPTEDKSDADKAAAATKADDKAEKKVDAADEEDAAKEKKKELERQRKEVEKQNKRKQDEYDEKIKKGEEKVKELNDRFADWYYIIADDVYRKIHLSREQIVKEGKKPDNDISPDALEKIKEKGLKADESN